MTALEQQTVVNEAEWADPANWSWGVYRSDRDTRVWVPKRVRWQGWTPNFAHRAAWVHAAVLLLVPLVITGGTVAVVVAASGAGE
ncbi:MAG: hypothetical protein AAF805_14025 [Planctomycetota bacterium]